MQSTIRFLTLVLTLISIIILSACSSQTTLTAENEITPTLSAYRSLLDSEIRGIDDQTIEDYLTEKGMGLALPAELNGYPGPRHVIDLA
jgi:hypothetical protein